MWGVDSEMTQKSNLGTEFELLHIPVGSQPLSKVLQDQSSHPVIIVESFCRQSLKMRCLGR